MASSKKSASEDAAPDVSASSGEGTSEKSGADASEASPPGPSKPKDPTTAEGWATKKMGIKFDDFGQIDYVAISREYHQNGTNRNNDAALFMAMRAQLGGAVGLPMDETTFDAAIDKAANTKFKG